MVRDKDLLGFCVYYNEDYDPQNDDITPTIDVFLIIREMMPPVTDDERYYAKVNAGKLADRRVYLNEIKEYGDN